MLTSPSFKKKGTFPMKNGDSTSVNLRKNRQEMKSDLSQEERRQELKCKKWRLIVRNLPFNTTREDLQNVFRKYGCFREIVLPKCKDKRFPESCAGFAFVQYQNVNEATLAMSELNKVGINDRKVAADWAIPKDLYDTTIHNEKSDSNENSQSKKTTFVDESDDEKNEQSVDDEVDDDANNEVEEEKTVHKIPSEREDKAVIEGRTVFVRNLSFDTTDRDLSHAFQRFGEIKLCLLCKYAGTEHSKGSAFVQFARKSDTDACLKDSDEDEGITLDGRRIFAHRAISKEQAVDLDKNKLEKNPKDRRNLHLLRVGVIRPGTAQARNMSEKDVQRRAQLALSTRSKLRNLKMFVSSNRLTLHNLPLSLSDSALKSICMLASDDVDAKIVECRIWRDMSRLNSKGEGRSRGFAFVAFEEHKHALTCLKELNNNPATFSDAKRPIVEFSIENRAALNMKQNRLDKSKRKTGKNYAKKSNYKERRPEMTDLEKTKREMSAGGKKPMPSHLGPKIRHRDSGKVAKKTGKRAGKNAKMTEKRTRIRSKDKMTKYLTLT